MAKTPTTNMDPLAGLTPEQLRAYLEPFGQEGDALDDQLKQAEALRNWQPSAPSYGALAGVGNGLATVLNAYSGNRDAKNARTQMAAMLQREQDSAFPLAQQYLIQALRGQQRPQPSPQQGLQADPYAPPPSSYGI